MEPTCVLAIENSTRRGSVALMKRDGTLSTAGWGEGAIQGRYLADRIRDLLENGGLAPSDVDLVAVGLGPGSYTGLRVAVALAKAFVLAAGCAKVGVSSLAALALAEAREGETVLCVAGAGRSVFACARFIKRGGRIEETLPHAVVTDEELKRLARGAERVLGEGTDSGLLPKAEAVAKLGLFEYRTRGPTPDSGFLPLYLRRSTAEINWEKLRKEKG